MNFVITGLSNEYLAANKSTGKNKETLKFCHEMRLVRAANGLRP